MKCPTHCAGTLLFPLSWPGTDTSLPRWGVSPPPGSRCSPTDILPDSSGGCSWGSARPQLLDASSISYPPCGTAQCRPGSEGAPVPWRHSQRPAEGAGRYNCVWWAALRAANDMKGRPSARRAPRKCRAQEVPRLPEAGWGGKQPVLGAHAERGEPEEQRWAWAER